LLIVSVSLTPSIAVAPSDAVNILQLKKTTAYRILTEYRETGRIAPLPRGGRKEANCKADDEMRQYLVELLERNPLLTLKEMANMLAERYPEKQRVSYKCVDRMLQGMLYTVKLAVKGADVRLKTNSEENVQQRFEYANFMLQLGPRVRTVFLDETGFNLWTRRSQGRAVRGRPVRRSVTTQRGPNVTVCMAINSEFGLLLSNVYRGGQTIQGFQEFFDELCARCRDLDEEAEWLVLMDGPNFHRGVRVQPQQQRHVSIRFLPPYSPFLNPTELANSALKARVKQLLADPQIIAEEAGRPNDVTQEEWRFMLLERLARQAIDGVITAEKVARWELSCHRVFGQCLQRQPF
jgi:transposase